MASSSTIVVEQCVLHFIHQWNLGLCPSLSLNTGRDGSIEISSCVSTFPAPYSQLPLQPYPSKRSRTNVQNSSYDNFRKKKRVKEGNATTNSKPDLTIKDVLSPKSLSSKHACRTISPPPQQVTFRAPDIPADTQDDSADCAFEFGDGISDVLDNLQTFSSYSIPSLSSTCLPKLKQSSETRPNPIPITSSTTYTESTSVPPCMDLTSPDFNKILSYLYDLPKLIEDALKKEVSKLLYEMV